MDGRAVCDGLRDMPQSSKRSLTPWLAKVFHVARSARSADWCRLQVWCCHLQLQRYLGSSMEPMDQSFAHLGFHSLSKRHSFAQGQLVFLFCLFFGQCLPPFRHTFRHHFPRIVLFSLTWFHVTPARYAQSWIKFASHTSCALCRSRMKSNADSNCLCLRHFGRSPLEASPL